ncbi:hypothetical protein COZ14_03435 [Candidatus Dojkabacteria bacterium CG_4_10_14_3_um_filter_Dojkabacteria_WS6_41_9]|uniref:Uncharacterized protein n=1 Tax=Candidatus Dojkabacteria bacterium CG_4_10_14_0_2_um_filter_Dojkabacteria_WS6_41_15 TaxID=2014249 RepID=A0A2M7W3N0_9BACT|nr:MAG: hypothetical protein COZ14_03435 [Candidatus Dojkabacteria bacterium CG_4_10_14_3_um_filter_Dojkabacteria_WS6_41_9]PJA15974.1 MAG: hypothetical protein COX64_00075 [Candidatus Dojkabacteria bacterium CG_4_10_14_0_2_um_filter_Dojkabacteria_WS6_41_15]
MSFFRKRGFHYKKDARVDLHSTSGNVAKLARERVRKVTVTKMGNAVRAVIFVILAVIFLGGLLGFLALVGYSLKTGGNVPFTQKVMGFLRTTPVRYLLPATDTKSEKRGVVGVQDVPEVPESTFVFLDYITRVGEYGFTLKEKSLLAAESQALYEFVTSGQSVYRLALTSSWEEVQQFYQQELPKLGWKFENSVTISDTEKVPGEYYTKGEKGLHVYTIAEDIWYEQVTKLQAEQGLHDKLVAYKAKQELVEAASGRDLPAEAVWKLSYSRDWDVALQKNVIYGVNNIYFTNNASTERITISVLGRYKGEVVELAYKDLEKVGTEYISTWLTTQQTTVTLTGFSKHERVVAGGKALEFADLKNRAYFLFLLNRKNGLYYVVQYVGKENPEFFEYIKGNLKN